jgi:hypothetical protein
MDFTGGAVAYSGAGVSILRRLPPSHELDLDFARMLDAVFFMFDRHLRPRLLVSLSLGA